MLFMFPRAVLPHRRVLSGSILLLGAGLGHAAPPALSSLEVQGSGTVTFVAAYVNGCIAGAVSSADCGPVWQLGIIAMVLMASIVALAVLRFFAYRPAGQENRVRAESKP